MYEFSPSGTFFKYQAMAIGARSQSARTYFEREFEAFPTATLSQLVAHAVKALQDCLPQDTVLNVSNCSLAVVGLDTKYHVIEGTELLEYLPAIPPTEMQL